MDNIERITGKTPQELIDLAKAKGFAEPGTKAGEILEWLKTDFGLGRGHGMAIVHIIKNGDKISNKHVGTGTRHSDESNRLDLKGKRKAKD